MVIANNRPFDPSHRSLDPDDYLKLVQKISPDALIVFFGDKQFKHPGDQTSLYLENHNPDLRMFMSLINQCDYFVGVDSVGQHMAKALGKPGLVIMGATSETNVSYPDHFSIFRNGKEPVYSPIRLTGIDCEFADRANDGIMTFSEGHLNKMADIINGGLYDC
jgi:ADP-heptose:LPS heptosyltransferase